MSEALTIVGIDPGLVDTGFVVMQFVPDQVVRVTPMVFTGGKVDEVVDAANKFRSGYVYIEAYRPRGNVYKQDKRMAELCSTLNQRIRRGKLIDNTGVKNVVSQRLMELFGVWDFSMKTHHQDLRSAARIALYGALKDAELNETLFDYAFSKAGI